jgi:gas vesicle protein
VIAGGTVRRPDARGEFMSDHDDLPYIVIERRGAGIGPFMWGAIVGAGVALLFAPRAGDQTREEIRSGVMRLRDRAEDAVRNVQTSVNDTIQNVRGEVTGRVDQAREAFEAGRQAARETRDDLEQRVRDTRARVRAGYDEARTDAGDRGDGSPGLEPMPEEDAEV